MAYDFSISGSTLVVILDTESGKFAESITVYSQPNLVLGNDRIFLKQEGLFLQEFTFENIGDINGDTATNLISAYELLDSLIKSIFVTTAQVDSRPYKVYTALLTQTGTGAPTIVIQEDTITGITVTYQGEGSYYIEKPGAFIENRTYYNITQKRPFSEFYIYRNDDNIIEINTFNSGVNVDGALSNTPIEIRVYN